MRILVSLLIGSLLLLGCAQPGTRSGSAPTATLSAAMISSTPLATPKPTLTPSVTPNPTQATTTQPPATLPIPTPTLEAIASTAPFQEFSVEVDDNGFYPNSITVNKSTPVKLTFKLRTTNVYFAGADLKSNVFNELGIKPGESRTVEFTPKESFKVSNYWPSQGVWKADLQVNVE